MTREQENKVSRDVITEEIRLPEGFLDRMRSLLGEEEYQAFLSSYGQKRLFSLRVNPLKCSREKFEKLVSDWYDLQVHLYDTQVQEEGPSRLRPVPWEPDGFYYPESFRPGRLPWHEAGMYYIQEASAMVPARLCEAQPGERVLDLCAAPGGKSTKLAADMRGQGLLVVNEIHPDRARILSSNIERMGVRNALVTNASPREMAVRFPLFFDRIVVDAPCSGEGMFRKEEEALVHWSLENVQMCADRQAEILEEAASMLRPGGRLVYSTCTFAPEENEGTISRFLADHSEFSVVSMHEGDRGQTSVSPDFGLPAGSVVGEGNPVLKNWPSIPGTVRLWPHRLEGEGHFAAVLRKAGEKPERNRDESEKGAKKKGKGKAGKKAGRPDPKEAELIGLWRQFRAETLTEEFAPASASLRANGDAQTQDAGGSSVKDPEENLFCFGDTLYALPVSRSILSLDGLRVLRAGLQLGTVTKGRFVPSHSLGMALRSEEAQRTIDLSGTSEAAYAWLRGEALQLPPDNPRWKGWVLVTIDGCAAGWGKAAGAMLKNHYPKGLRKGSGYRLE